MNDKITIPAGAKIRPSVSGYYNFWYPSEEEEYEAPISFDCQRLRWTGSGDWDAVLVSPEQARNYNSPIKVIWVKKDIIKNIQRELVFRTRMRGKG